MNAIRIDNVYTLSYIPPMPRTPPSLAEKRHAFISADAEHPSLGPKGSINLRIEAQTRQLIDDAAAALGKTRTEFMIESARALAIDTLLDRRLFTLDAQSFDAFTQALDNPPAPGPRLRALLQRKPAWEE